jgi:ATP:corrinoid adenosyltransferase
MAEDIPSYNSLLGESSRRHVYIFTGDGKLVQLADTVTGMLNLHHPYNKGVMAQERIDC